MPAPDSRWDDASEARRNMTTICPEQPGDYVATDQLNQLAFGQDGEARLVAKLREADGCDSALSLVAIRGDRVVDHVVGSGASRTAGGQTPPLRSSPAHVAMTPSTRGAGRCVIVVNPCCTSGSAVHSRPLFPNAGGV